jgi:hypothetical protein
MGLTTRADGQPLNDSVDGLTGQVAGIVTSTPLEELGQLGRYSFQLSPGSLGVGVKKAEKPIEYCLTRNALFLLLVSGAIHQQQPHRPLSLGVVEFYLAVKSALAVCNGTPSLCLDSAVLVYAASQPLVRGQM